MCDVIEHVCYLLLLAGEEGGVETSQEQEALLAEAPANNYLLCLAEGEAAPTGAVAGSSGGGSGAAVGDGAEPLVGVVAVETSTGDVLYGTCRWGNWERYNGMCTGLVLSGVLRVKNGGW